MKENKVRIAVIDSSTSTLHIEDVLEEDIKEYGGDIDTYVEENYDISNCTWQVINSIHLVNTNILI